MVPRINGPSILQCFGDGDNGVPLPGLGADFAAHEQRAGMRTGVWGETLKFLVGGNDVAQTKPTFGGVQVEPVGWGQFHEKMTSEMGVASRGAGCRQENEAPRRIGNGAVSAAKPM